MKKTTYYINTDTTKLCSTLMQHHQLLHSCDSEQHLYYIDIETMGFNRKSDMIYLVGILEVTKENQLRVEQFLCQKTSDEYELLYTLNSRLNENDILIHFNGDSFDLPFIKARMALYGIAEKLSDCISIDYYKLLRPFKKIFQTDNFKLKTLERIALYTRTDSYTGGDLIHLYTEYLHGNHLLESSFLEHNKEDLVGLFHLNIFNPLYQLINASNVNEALWNNASTQWSFHTASKDETCFEVSCENFQPSEDMLCYTFKATHNSFSLSLTQGILTLSLPMSEGVYTYFYDDYHNYYYLPHEDYAVHKIVADFVSSKHKKKATKATAYIKKEGRFLCIPYSKSNLLLIFNTLGVSIPIFQDASFPHYSYVLFDDFQQCYQLLFLPIIKQQFLN